MIRCTQCGADVETALQQAYESGVNAGKKMSEERMHLFLAFKSAVRTMVMSAPFRSSYPIMTKELQALLDKDVSEQE